MAVVAGLSSTTTPHPIAKIFTFETNRISSLQLLYTTHSSPLSAFCTPCSIPKHRSKRLFSTHSSPRASSSSSDAAADDTQARLDIVKRASENGSQNFLKYIVEPTTDVKFETALSLPGCSSPLSLLGTGYREKVFAIIGVKVYAVGLYANYSIIENLNAWKGRPETEYQEDSSFFNTIHQVPLEKALQIVLVRDISGKTFWDALNDAISPRIKASTDDEAALSKFRGIFQDRPLKKGTVIVLTWLDPSKMLVCISSDGLPSTVDATIESRNINFALFDVFFGDAPVSPSLKAAVCNGLAKILR